MYFLVNGLAYYKFIEDAKVVDKKFNTSGRLSVCAVISDSCISLSALVIGILSLVGVLQGLPPAASYTLIGLSGLITLTWLDMAYWTKGFILSGTKDLFINAVSSNPDPNFNCEPEVEDGENSG